jgi:hypothetical protein
MSLIGRVALKKVAKGFPVGRLLLAGDVAILAGRHLARLNAAERRRLASLVARSAAPGRGGLGAAERVELAALIAKLEPRLLFGTAVRRLSPVPVPRRLLYGRRGSAARAAAKKRS